MKFLLSLLFTFAVCAPGFGADENQGYYRFPTIHGNTIIFTSEGDLWRVPVKGGIARRLTSHLETESRADFSPDGKLIAFAASYEGPTEIYTMPANGGQPTRLTYEGYSGSRSPYPVGWKSGIEVLYGTRYFARRDPFQIAVVNTQTKSHSVIPLEQASDGVFGSQGKNFYFTRLPRQSSHAKRYRGGFIENLWQYQSGSDEAEPLTADYDGTSRTPMLWKGRLYFTSDRDGTMNVWSMKTDGSDVQQHTKFADFDVLAPDLQNGRIVFQRGADLWLYNIAKDESAIVPIRLSTDFDQKRVRWLDEPLSQLTDFNISADGKRVAVTVRGRGFVAPVKPGRLVSVPQKPGTRFRSVAFLPKTSDVYYLSDETGETEFWSQPANGVSGKARQITDDASVLRYNGQPSPDGSKVVFTDRDQVLWLLDVKTGATRKILQSQDNTTFDSPDLAWSPDSRWLAFMDAGANAVQRIFLVDSNAEKSPPVAVTTDRLDSYSPGFSADGKWLYFLSDRTFRSVQSSPWGARAPEAYLDKTTSIFALDLVGGQRSPFQPGDELTDVAEKKTAVDDDSKSDAKSKDADKKEEPKSEYKLTDFSGRLFRVPVEAGNYGWLKVAKGHLYFTQTPLGLSRTRQLNAFPISNEPNEQKVTRIDGDMTSYRLSADRSNIVLRNDKRLFVFAANGKAPNFDTSRIDLSAIQVGVSPADEWQQMFVDAWRLHRDYFYDPGMHDVDWKGIREKHEALLPRVADRHELDDLIAMMVGELSAMHTSISPGAVRGDSEDAGMGYLGAILKRANDAGGYKVEVIYQNDPDFPEKLSPLQQAGVDVKVGDVITSIDGLPTLSVADARQLLLNKANRQVLIQRKREGEPEPRSFIVRPLGHNDFRSLKLSEWEYTRRLETEKRSAGNIGYFHMRAMTGGNYAEFVKGFYPVFNRQGLIIDMRQNYGGNIDSWILGRLMRKAWMYWQARTGRPSVNMQFAFSGHMVVLIDPYTISDGEAFSEGFRRLGLGPLIGTRTWGGGIWLRSSNRLVDGGIARSPEFGVYSPDRTWLIEGSGVSPDIEVDNLPHQTFNGKDAQLEAAIEFLQKKIKDDPPAIPAAPDYPDKAGQP